MPSFYRTEILKIEPQPIFSEVNAASAEVWNTCSTLMDLYQYQRGYPHAHRDFYFGKECAGWIDKKLSHPLLHSQSRQAVLQRYFQSWKSYSVLKKMVTFRLRNHLTKQKTIRQHVGRNLLSSL